MSRKKKDTEKLTTHEEIVRKQRDEDRKKPPFYWSMPWNVVREINKLGYNFTWKNILATYAATLALIGALCFSFQLNALWTVICLIFGVIVSPKFVMNNYKNKYEMARFNDVNTYIEQMLYAFANSGRVLTALKDVSILFQQGTMRESIDHAIEIIQNPSDDEEADVEEIALDGIAERYPNQYIRQMHRFILKVERVGGDFDDATKLLIQNRVNWQARTDYVVTEEKKKRRDILLSCVCAVGLVLAMLYMLPSDVTIFPNTVVQVFNVFLIMTSVLIYQRADSKLALNLVKSRDDRTEESCQKDYEKYCNYNKKKGFIQSIKYSIVPAVGAFGYLIFHLLHGRMEFKNWAIFFVIVAIAIVFEYQAELGHNAQKKRLQGEVMSAFPEWMLEMSLLLQSDNVQVSIFKSEETARPAIKPELRKMIDAIKEHPADPEPFLNFCYVFDLPTIMTSMQMLYSLSVGSGGDPQAQIRNIVERNNRDMDQAERVKCQNRLAGMTLLFLLPVLAASVALMVDMMIFLTEFMGTMNTDRFVKGNGVEVTDQSVVAEQTELPEDTGKTPFFDKDGRQIYYDKDGKLFVIVDGKRVDYSDTVMYDDKGNEFKVTDFVEDGKFKGINGTGLKDKYGHDIYYDNNGKLFIIDDYNRSIAYDDSIMYDADGNVYYVDDFMGVDGFRGIAHTGFYTGDGKPIYYDRFGKMFVMDDYNHAIAYDKSVFYDSNGVEFEVKDFAGVSEAGEIVFKGINYTGLKDQYGHNIYYDNSGKLFTIDDYNHTISYDGSIAYDGNGNQVSLNKFTGVNPFYGPNNYSGVTNFSGEVNYSGSGFGGVHNYQNPMQFHGVRNFNKIIFNGVANFDSTDITNGFHGVQNTDKVNNLYQNATNIIDNAMNSIGH